jgi:acetyltransferase-like isoleucine patch superfamily enzyme
VAHIGRNGTILAYDSVEIGENCLIAPFCYITDANHVIEPDILIREQPLVAGLVRIGNDNG